MTDQDWHKVYSEEFFDAVAEARGAYMGTCRLAGKPHTEGLDAAIAAAFNAGVRTGLDNADD